MAPKTCSIRERIRAIVYDLKFSAKIFPRDKFFQIRQYITVFRQILQTVVYVKKSVQHVRLQYCS